MEITDKTLCRSIETSWKIALETNEDIKNHLRRWNNIINELTGIFSMLNFASNSADERKVFNEIVDDISFLKEFAMYHCYNCYHM